MAEVDLDDAPVKSRPVPSGLHVLGGRQRSPQGMRELDDRWYGYGQGVVVEIDGGAARTVLEYTSAEGTCDPDDPILFKSATLVGDRLYACTQTELLVFSYPELGQLHHVSHPLLNDVHHVIPGRSADTLIAAASGHDAVVELNLNGELVELWSVDGSDPWARIEADRDYRHNCDLKPHAYHPNYLFRLGEGSGGGAGEGGEGEVWATRFETRDAVAIADPTRRIVVGRERCHDGVVHGDRIYFTTVDGYVVEVDRDTLEVVAEHQLVGSRPNTLLGWCRGLAFVDGCAVLGFSRIRHTKVRGTLSWIRNGLTGSEPTRIAAYDPSDWSLLDEVDLEPAGCNAVFTIVASR